MTTPKTHTLGELAEILRGKVTGDPDTPIHGIAKIDEARQGDLTFLTNPKYQKKLTDSDASALLAGHGITWDRPVLQVDDNYGDARFLVRSDGNVGIGTTEPEA